VFLGPSGIRLSIPETILIPPCCNREYGKTRGIKENVRRTEKKKKKGKLEKTSLPILDEISIVSYL